jgi:long-chain acyl-CoA synthetase
MRGCEPIDDPRVLTWKQFLARGDAHHAELDARIAALAPTDVATLIYTSGTTGKPKGVMLSHANLAWAAHVLVTLGRGTARDTVLSYLPLSHIAEQLATIHLPTTTGSPVYYCEAIDKVRANVPEVRPTIFFGVPRVWEKFHSALVARFADLPPRRRQLLEWTRGVCTQVNARKMRGEPLGLALSAQYAVAQRLVLGKLKSALGMDRARILVSGSAPIAKHILEFFASIDLVIHELYGMSECVPISYNVDGKTKLGTVGPIVPGLDVKIADDGEVLVRGPGVFLGYFKDPTATREALVDD